MNISVCIIAKNEEKNIRRCLESLKPYPFEMIVVDTGSWDRTKEIAFQYTRHVYDFVWCDDFAAAKNFAVSKASHSHIMILDSDEYIKVLDFEKLLDAAAKHPDGVGRIQRVNILTRKNEIQEKKEWINRIFAKDKYHYEGRIHEQVEAFSGGNYETYPVPLIIGHTGYDLPMDLKREKAFRNIHLLKEELKFLEEAKNEEKIPYILYQLGKGYYMAEEYACACEYFARGLSYDLNPKLEYVIDMVETYGYALLNSNQKDAALFFENIYQEFGNTADFQFLMGLIYMNNARFSEAVQEFQKAAGQKDAKTTGINSYAAYYNIGVICECLGDKDEAAKYYKMCREYRPAKERLQDLDMKEGVDRK